ncbi:MAG: hypothetical protein NTX01_08570 [Candidatus Omnitrophica bacterium]|nr:hypothetical protein [Candidatus Omnitrophota bacterium]
MKNILICMVFGVVAFCATSARADLAQTVTVNANIATLADGLNVTVNKVIDTVWNVDTSINFDTLAWDTVNQIFLPNCYYAVDIVVSDNTATEWTVTHTRASLVGPGGANIDDKVNVVFVKQTSPSVGIELKKLSFASSNDVAYAKTFLVGGWLRIYYGVGTGDPAKPDAPGVTPIGLDSPAGTYTGSVTITLTP